MVILILPNKGVTRTIFGNHTGTDQRGQKNSWPKKVIFNAPIIPTTISYAIKYGKNWNPIIFQTIWRQILYCMFLGLLNVEAMVETVVLCKQRCLQWGRFQLPSGVLCNVSLFCFGETFLIPKEGKVYRKQNLDRGTASSFEESSPHLCLSIICVAQAMMPPLCFPIHTTHILQLWSILIFL